MLRLAGVDSFEEAPKERGGRRRGNIGPPNRRLIVGVTEDPADGCCQVPSEYLRLDVALLALPAPFASSVGHGVRQKGAGSTQGTRRALGR